MSSQPTNLLLLWTTADREVALNMIFMYGHNSRKHGWWEQVHLLIWGPAQKLILADEALKAELREMQDAGVEALACKACSDRYGVSDDLTALGVNVLYTGELLTNTVKSDEWAVLTF
jgi:hypothetical protein